MIVRRHLRVGFILFIISGLAMLLAACRRDLAEGTQPLPVTTESIETDIPRFAFEVEDQYLIIEFLDDDLVHFELSGLGPAPSIHRPIYTTQMVSKTDYSGPSKLTHAANGRFETSELRIQVDPRNLCVTATDISHALELTLSQICPWQMDEDFKGITFTPESFTHAYGLGQKFLEPGSTDGDWVGQSRYPGEFGNVMQGFDQGAAGNTQFPVVYLAGDGTNSYSLFFDNPYKQVWDFTHEPYKAVMWGDWLRFYIMSGPDLQDLRTDYMELVGHPPVPPLKMFGLWISEYGFENWEELEDKLRTLRENRFPVDGFILDLQWFGGIEADSDDTQEGSLTWDLLNFPDPGAKIESLRDQEGLGLMLIEQSYIGRNLPEHDDLEARGFLVRKCETCDPVYLTQNPWWGKGGMLDWTNPAAGEYWHDWKREPLIELGILGHWTDLGEPELYDPEAWYWGISGDYQVLHEHRDIHNLYNLLWSKSIFEGYTRNNHDQRPFILSRSGAPGIQRFGVAMWSGDIAGKLTSLAAHLNAQMHMSMSGVDYYGSDIGGFWRQEVDWDETYTQWFADSSALDIPVRPHTFNLDNFTETAPDRIGDLASNLENIRLRYALSPYLYSLAHRAYLYAEPVFPPLVYYFQEDPAVRQMGGEKLIGRDLLVAGIAETGTVERSVYLPRGLWTDFRTGERFISEGEWFDTYLLYPDGKFKLPMFAKAGAIIPMMYVDEKTMNILGRRLDGSVRDELIVRVYADEQPSSFTLFEDDGWSITYQKGEVRKTVIKQEQSENEVRVAISAAEGSFENAVQERGNRIELHTAIPMEAIGVFLDGEPLPSSGSEEALQRATQGWYMDDGGTVIVKTAEIGVDVEKVFRFSFSGESRIKPPIQEPLTAVWPGTDWQSAIPEQLGLDSERLSAAIGYVEQKELPLHELVVVRNGYRAVEVPFYHITRGSQSDRFSVTGVVLSTLVGMAVDQGYIEGVDHPVLEFFADREIDRQDSRKQAITIEHLLTHTSGLACEGVDDRITQEEDWIQAILDLPMQNSPGRMFLDCGTDMHLLSAVLQQATGMNAFEYAQQVLFAPLDIHGAVWKADPQGVSLGWNGLEMTTLDTAKIGLLYLRDGKWEGNPLLPREWVDAALRPYTEQGSTRFGYQWSLDPLGVYIARDGLGQWLVLEPETETVFVLTGGQRAWFALPIRILLRAFLLEALHPDPLPANQGALAALETRIEEIGRAPAPQPVPELPETAKKISGSMYVASANPLGWDEVGLIFPGGDEAKLAIVSNDIRAELPIGLDEVSRVPGLDPSIPDEDMVALRGRWISENEFVIDYDFVYFLEKGAIKMVFKGDVLEVTLEAAPFVITASLKK